MTPARIFLSYRRDDSAGHARAIGEALARRFGADQVFIDVDDIGAGQAFDQSIRQAMDQARVLLVLIGRRWLAVPDGAGRPRLHEDQDVVRQELESALRGGLQIIPLLLDGAAMPAAEALPATLQPLAKRQALAIDHARFAADMARLVGVLEATLGAPARPGRRRLLALTAVGGAAAATALGAGLWWWRGRSTAAMIGPAARPAVNGRWQAELRYDWLAGPLVERFEFSGEGLLLQGSASFLRVPRTLVEGRIEADGRLSFATRSLEQLGAAQRELTHRYQGRLVGGRLQLRMTTEGSAVPQQPRDFEARPAPA
ncbi:MAG: toll/interleukin-1 receptor domain-containing protein [Burkholderiaceae bacterium]|nr:toll/interleukin-1 receptor domain-containing protein [Burkholderiaceae bacterium]